MPGRPCRVLPPVLALVLAALLLGSAACGEPPGERPDPFSGPQVDSSDTRAYTLMHLVARADTLTAVAEALRQAGLSRELQEGGPYTLFAPTDRAVRRRFPELRALLTSPDSLARAGLSSRSDSAGPGLRARPPAPNRDSLRTLLRFHLVRGRLTAARVPDSLRVSTLLREPLVLRRGRDNPSSLRVFTGSRGPAARVIRTRQAQNGVLHLIDRPLRVPAPDTSAQDSLGPSTTTP